jgi:hypothetical protein
MPFSFIRIYHRGPITVLAARGPVAAEKHETPILQKTFILNEL